MSGRREIRTLERREPLSVFETDAFNHSAILPFDIVGNLFVPQLCSQLSEIKQRSNKKGWDSNPPSEIKPHKISMCYMAFKKSVGTTFVGGIGNIASPQVQVDFRHSPDLKLMMANKGLKQLTKIGGIGKAQHCRSTYGLTGAKWRGYE